MTVRETRVGVKFIQFAVNNFLDCLRGFTRSLGLGNFFFFSTRSEGTSSLEIQTGEVAAICMQRSLASNLISSILDTFSESNPRDNKTATFPPV